MNRRIEAKDKEHARRREIDRRNRVAYSDPVYSESLCGKTLYWREHDGGREYVSQKWVAG
jgi:hypothetical protein